MQSNFFIRKFGDESLTKEEVKRLLMSEETIDESELFIKRIEGTEDLEKLNEELAKFEEEQKKSSSSLSKQLNLESGNSSQT